MGYTKFFSSKKTRGLQQPYIKNIILGTQKQQTSSQGWINQEKREKTSPKGGMAKWVLWRANQRSKLLGLKCTLQGVTTLNLSKNRHYLAFHLARKDQNPNPYFLSLKPSPLFFLSILASAYPRHTSKTTSLFVLNLKLEHYMGGPNTSIPQGWSLGSFLVLIYSPFYLSRKSSFRGFLSVRPCDVLIVSH